MTHAHNVSGTEELNAAARLRVALESGDLDAYGALLADDVRWGGPDETPETCHGRTDVLNRLASLRTSGIETRVLEVAPGVHSVLVGFSVIRPEGGGAQHGHSVYQVLTLRDGHVADIRGYPDRAMAAAQAGITSADDQQPRIRVREVTPILNVSNLQESFAWFTKLGWSKKWDWAAPGGVASFGAVACDGFEIFLCLDNQGGRGRDGAWLALWVDDVDAVHTTCLQGGLEVTRPPQNETWGVREMHVRHPDGHVFRLAQEMHTH